MTRPSSATAAPALAASAPATRLVTVHPAEDLPQGLDPDTLATFLHRSLHPYQDTLPDIRRGLDHARSTAPGQGGEITLALQGRRLVGTVVVLKTGMSGYVPGHLLLFVAVDPSLRGQGLGGRLVQRAVKGCDGDIALHVEYDNPAKRLYERLGFRSKYAEMRYQP